MDQDHSRLSRDLTRAILANETFSLAGYANSAADFRELAVRDRAHVCFIFRRGFESALMRGENARVDVLVDNSDYLVGGVETSNISTILTSYSIGVNTLVVEAIHGIPEPSARRAAVPLDLGQRMLFNPAFNSNYLNFMVPAFSLVPLQLAALLATIRAGSSAVSYTHLWAARATLRSALQMQRADVAELAPTHERFEGVDEKRSPLSPEDLQLLIEESDALRARLDILCRFVLVMHGIAKESCEEVAAQLGVSQSAVQRAYCVAFDTLHLMSKRTLCNADIPVVLSQ